MRQAQVRQHQLENQVRIEVRNAQFDVRQNRASFFDVQSKGYYTEYSNGLPDSTYTTANQIAIGK